MLNGDVLTDIDLTAQIAQHERTGARGDARARRRSRTRPPTGSCARSDDGEVTEFVEKPAPGPDRHQQHLRRRLRARALGARRCSRPSSRPRSSATSSRASSATASTATSPTATGSTSGRPSATSQGDVRHPRGRRSRRGRRARMGDGYLCVEEGVENAGRIVPSALVESGCRIGEGARIGGRVVLERGVTVGEGTTIERAGRACRAPRSARTARCAAASSAAGVRIGDALPRRRA